MKIYHFVLIFFIFFLGAIIKTDILAGRLKAVDNEKKEIERSLTTAVSDAVEYMTETGTHGESTINRQEVLTIFFTSLYSSMGIISDKAAQAEVEIYIPVILICDIDGYYVYYYDEYEASDGNTYIERTWTEKMPYSYEDEYFVYRFTLTDMVYIYDKYDLLNQDKRILYTDYKEFSKDPLYEKLKLKYKDCILLRKDKFETAKKTSVINKLEDVMAYYTSRHNHIAGKQGITYSFIFPYGKEDKWADYIDDVNMIVVFQGYPYGPGRDYRFNKILSAEANIVKKPKYYVEEKSWYRLAHVEGCDKLKESSTLLDETFDSIEECVQLGAYCCDCIEHGARVPDLK